jgi:release factor glutamine methyltransferase
MNSFSRLEEDILACEALGINRSKLIINPALKDKDDPKLKEFKERREKHEPLAYIVGCKPFMGINILVDSRVLIPRPETELLAEEAIKLAKELPHPISILDLCTGSGAIAVSLAKYLPQAKIFASDACAEALAVAQKNAENQAVKITFVQSDLFGTLKGKKFDLIVANPPYIPTKEIDTLQPEVKDFEPRMALDGGSDGLRVVCEIIHKAKEHLVPGGALLMEIGFGQWTAVKKELKKNGYKDICVIKDYAGIERIIKCSV